MWPYFVAQLMELVKKGNRMKLLGPSDFLSMPTALNPNPVFGYRLKSLSKGRGGGSGRRGSARKDAITFSIT